MFRLVLSKYVIALNWYIQIPDNNNVVIFLSDDPALAAVNPQNCTWD